MPARIPRLYRKHTGVYWVRVLVPKDDTEAVMPQPRASGLATHADTLRPSVKEPPLGIEYFDPSTHDYFSEKSGKRKSEIRRSLRTKNPSEAATMASKLNAALSDAPRSNWGKIMQEFLSNSPERPEKTSGESRESALIQMMREFPELRQALAENIKNNGLAALGMGAAMQGLPTEAHPVAEASLAAAVVTPAQQPARPASVSTSHYGGAVDLPARPTRLQDAIAEYKKRLAASELKVRTVKSQVRSIDSFSEWLELAKPSMGKNPYVHQILAPEINAYISHHAQNRGGRGNHSKAAHIPLDGRIPFDDNKSEPKIKASTRKKRLLEISKFFNFAHRQLKACKENPVADLEDVMRDLASKARAQLESYMPFSDQDIKALFDPVQYMLLTPTPTTSGPPCCRRISVCGWAKSFCRGWTTFARTPMDSGTSTSVLKWPRTRTASAGFPSPSHSSTWASWSMSSTFDARAPRDCGPIAGSTPTPGGPTPQRTSRFTSGTS